MKIFGFKYPEPWNRDHCASACFDVFAKSALFLFFVIFLELKMFMVLQSFSPVYPSREPKPNKTTLEFVTKRHFSLPVLIREQKREKLLQLRPALTGFAWSAELCAGGFLVRARPMAAGCGCGPYRKRFGRLCFVAPAHYCTRSLPPLICRPSIRTVQALIMRWKERLWCRGALQGSADRNPTLTCTRWRCRCEMQNRSPGASFTKGSRLLFEAKTITTMLKNCIYSLVAVG